MAGEETEVFNALFGDATEQEYPPRPATEPKIRLRLDFTPDNATVVRARLRSGSGSKRSKKNGGIYVPLGRIEDVYNDDYYQEWHGRCEAYAERTGYKLVKSGSGIRPHDSSTVHRVAEFEEVGRKSVVDGQGL